MDLRRKNIPKDYLPAKFLPKIIFICFLISIFNFLNPTAGFAEENTLNWWNSDWNYRKGIIIQENSGNTLTDYQIVLDVTYEAKMQSNFNDLRFTNEDGTILLSYWIENYVASTSARVWVKIPSIPADGTTKIYMYYGNPSAESASNGDATFEFFDDFLTDTWTDSRGGWQATTFQGRTVLQSGAAPWGGSYTMNQQTYKSIGDVGENWAVELQTYWDSPAGNYGRYWFIIFTDQGTVFPPNSGYSGLSSELYWDAYNEHRIQRIEYPLPPDPRNYDWAIASGAPNKNTWARQTLKKFGGKISYTDAITVSREDPSPFTTFAYLDLHHNCEGAGAAGKLNVDWIFVRKYVEPEPTVLTGPEEVLAYVPKDTDREKLIEALRKFEQVVEYEFDEYVWLLASSYARAHSYLRSVESRDNYMRVTNIGLGVADIITSVFLGESPPSIEWLRSKYNLSETAAKAIFITHNIINLKDLFWTAADVGVNIGELIVSINSWLKQTHDIPWIDYNVMLGEVKNRIEEENIFEINGTKVKLSAVKNYLREKCEEFIVSIPNPLPEDYPTEVVINWLGKLSNTIKASGNNMSRGGSLIRIGPFTSGDVRQYSLGKVYPSWVDWNYTLDKYRYDKDRELIVWFGRTAQQIGGIIIGASVLLTGGATTPALSAYLGWLGTSAITPHVSDWVFDQIQGECEPQERIGFELEQLLEISMQEIGIKLPKVFLDTLEFLDTFDYRLINQSRKIESFDISIPSSISYIYPTDESLIVGGSLALVPSTTTLPYPVWGCLQYVSLGGGPDIPIALTEVKEIGNEPVVLNFKHFLPLPKNDDTVYKVWYWIEKGPTISIGPLDLVTEETCFTTTRFTFPSTPFPYYLGEWKELYKTDGYIQLQGKDYYGFWIPESALYGTFSIDWPGSDLNLTLIQPDGKLITPRVARMDPYIIFAFSSTREVYTIKNPMPGNWQMVVEGVKVPPEGESYTARVLGFIPDSTPPTTKDDYAYNNVWTNKDAHITLTATDDLSGVKQTFYSISSGSSLTVSEGTSIDIVSEGEYVIEYWSVDKAGNEEPYHRIIVKIDKTPPITTVSLSATPNEAGWINTLPVNVTFEATDNLSGIASTTPDVSIDGEGIHEISYYSTDNAGNVEEAKTITVRIDVTSPQINLNATPNMLWPPDHKMVDVTINDSTTDALSGIASTTLRVTDKYGVIEPIISDFGSTIQLEAWRNGGDRDGRIYTISVTVIDYAENEATTSTTVICPHDQRKK